MTVYQLTSIILPDIQVETMHAGLCQPKQCKLIHTRKMHRKHIQTPTQSLSPRGFYIVDNYFSRHKHFYLHISAREAFP